MSTFRIYVDEALFYHPSLTKLAITEAKVTENAESIDSLSLSAPFNHPYLSQVKPISSIIVCKLDDRIVFQGRAIDEGTDFYNTHTWTCESCLAYLKDTLQPPFEYKGPLRGLLEQFINVHNQSVEEQKQFQIGTVTVTDDNDYISYSNSDYSITMDAIKNKLIDTHGGYLRIRYVGSLRYLDYLKDFDGYSSQSVEFGKNLLNVKITKDHAERITALIPFGAKKTEEDEEGNVSELDERIDITEVNHGLNYVYDETAVNEIGWIWATEVWEDVTKPLNLLKKSQARVKELAQGVTSMELTIVDESDSDSTIDDITSRMYVDCFSKPHGINGRYLVLGRQRDYLNPAGNTITIGATNVTLTSAAAKQSNAISSLESDIFGQTTKIEKITGEIDTINAQKMYRTELVVEGVSIFKNKGQKSTMRCKVFSWDKDITDTIDAECFIWHRKSADEEADNEWDKNHKGIKEITITTEDVYENASFYCEINL